MIILYQTTIFAGTKFQCETSPRMACNAPDNFRM